MSGAGAATGARTLLVGAGRVANLDLEFEFVFLVAPVTAEFTVWETRGEI